MKYLKTLSFFLFLSATTISSINIQAETLQKEDSQAWNLPLEISDANTKINFEVDSTWHLVKGSTKNLSGQVSYVGAAEDNILSIKAVIPVDFFDTDNSSRDKKMKKVMAASSFPNVVFSTEARLNKCTPKITREEKTCSEVIRGEITIRDKTLPIELPLEILAQDSGFLIKARTKLNWEKFGVEDPSIFVAKLDEVVEIFLEIRV